MVFLSITTPPPIHPSHPQPGTSKATGSSRPLVGGLFLCDMTDPASLEAAREFWADGIGTTLSEASARPVKFLVGTKVG